MSTTRNRPGLVARTRAILSANPGALVGTSLLALFLFLAIAGPLLVPDPIAFVAVPHSEPSFAHPLGTTGQGQDVLAQTVVGARLSLLVGVVVGLLSVLVGAAVGVTAGYFGGLVDDVLSLAMNVLLVIPGLPLAIILAAYLPASTWTVATVLVVTGWAWNARVLRAQSLSMRERDFISAARVAGESHWRIVFVEMLPNMASLLLTQFIGATVYAIGAQVGLEFLGLGDVGRVTWGTNLYWASNDQALLTGAWWTFVPTGVCIALVGFSLTLLNAAVDEVTNPALGAERVWATSLRRMGILPGAATPILERR